MPPELLFGRGLGELFIIRVAGNTVDLTGLGSIEYAVAELGVPLILVLGHERCGAVAAAVSVVEKNATFPGAIGQMVEPIVPAVLRAQGPAGRPARQCGARERPPGGHRAAPARRRSCPSRPQAGRIKIVGARYDLDNGEVDFFAES